MNKLPWFKFFPTDWLADPGLRSVSAGARGLWIDMLCVMHDCRPRGFLQLANGSPFTSSHLARLAGMTTEEVDQLVVELESVGVLSRTAQGVIYSRRMTRDERKRKLCSEAGKRGGGNPMMDSWKTAPGFIYVMRHKDGGDFKIGASISPRNRRRKGNGTLGGGGFDILMTWKVQEMGTCEEHIHELYAEKCSGGEWFSGLTNDDFLDIERALKEHPKGVPKGGLKRQEARSQKSEAKRSDTTPPAPPSGGLPESKSKGFDPGDRGQVMALASGPLTNGLDSPEFWAAWSAWIAHLKAKGRNKLPTKEAVRRQVRKLEGLGPAESVRWIEHAIERNWQGLYEPKGAAKGNGQSEQRKPFWEGMGYPSEEAYLEAVAERDRQRANWIELYR